MQRFKATRKVKRKNPTLDNKKPGGTAGAAPRSVSSQNGTDNDTAQPIKQVDPSEIYNQATEYKTPAAPASSGTGDGSNPSPGSEPPVYKDELDVNELNAHLPSDPEPDPSTSSGTGEPKPKKDYFDSEMQAKVFISTLDPLQAEGYRAMFKARRLGRDLHKKGKELRKMDKQGIRKKETFTAEEMSIYLAYEDYLDECESLPYSDEETEALVTSLAGMIEESGKRLPPWMGFLLAFTKVNAVRIGALMID